jgi:hypothetical protein
MGADDNDKSLVISNLNIDSSHNIITTLPFAHLAESSPYFAPVTNMESYFRRNSHQIMDLYMNGPTCTNQVRSRAGSSFEIGDCYSKESNNEDNFYLGTVTAKPLYSNS